MDLEKLGQIDSSKSATEQLEQVNKMFYSEYPDNLDPQDGMMDCFFFLFLRRMNPFAVLNYIYCYDLFFYTIFILSCLSIEYKVLYLSLINFRLTGFQRESLFTFYWASLY